MKNKLTKVFLIILFIIGFLLIYFLGNILRNKNRSNPIEIMAQQNVKQENVGNQNELKVVEKEIDGKLYEVIAILNIPTLEIEYPVFSSTSKELLKISLNKYWGPNPNKPGNFCILGHNYNDEKFFGKLNRIEKGEKIKLTDMYGVTLEYIVYDMYIVEPEDTSCTTQLTNGETEVTLITCTKDFKKRFVVKARAEQ